MIEFTCQRCRKKSPMPEELDGQKGYCPFCGKKQWFGSEAANHQRTPALSPSLTYHVDIPNVRHIAVVIILLSVALFVLEAVDLVSVRLLGPFWDTHPLVQPVRIAEYVVGGVLLLCSVVWLFQVHLDIPGLTGRAYEITPVGAVLQVALPLLNLWGFVRVSWALLDQVENFDKESKRDTPFITLGYIAIIIQFFVILAVTLIAAIALALWFLEAEEIRWLGPTLLIPPALVFLPCWALFVLLAYAGINRRVDFLRVHLARPSPHVYHAPAPAAPPGPAQVQGGSEAPPKPPPPQPTVAPSPEQRVAFYDV